VFEIELMIGADATTPFVVFVSVLVAEVRVLVVAPVRSGNKFKFAPVTPFTVVVRFVPVKELETPLTALLVATTPFTVDVRVFVARLRVLVVAPVSRGSKFSDVLGTPFTVLVKLVPVRPKTFVLMMLAV
jgi:hypothetical protein